MRKLEDMNYSLKPSVWSTCPRKLLASVADILGWYLEWKPISLAAVSKPNLPFLTKIPNGVSMLEYWWLPYPLSLCLVIPTCHKSYPTCLSKFSPHQWRLPNKPEAIKHHYKNPWIHHDPSYPSQNPLELREHHLVRRWFACCVCWSWCACCEAPSWRTEPWPIRLRGCGAAGAWMHSQVAK